MAAKKLSHISCFYLWVVLHRDAPVEVGNDIYEHVPIFFNTKKDAVKWTRQPSCLQMLKKYPGESVKVRKAFVSVEFNG